MTVAQRLFPPTPSSFFLFGPRGTGKSTWLKKTYPNALWIDLLEPVTLRTLLAKPERLTEWIAASDATDVVIDEVQKAPAVLDVVHQLVESGTRKRFILTGSSARKLRRGSANLLAGRLIERSMHPFMAAELGAQFDLQLALQQGLVPLIMGAAQPARALSAYASLYLHEEVQAEALVRNVGAFARFLEAISFSQSSTLNLSEVARECEVGRKTVEGYLSILEDLLLSFRIPVFAKRAKRQLIAHDKFYFFDAGVFRSLRPAGPLDKPSEIEGQALEGLVAQHLRAWLAYRKDALGQAPHEQAELYFWRTKSGSEVDFVIYGADVFVAVEVKRSDKVHSVDLRALKDFKTDYPEAQVMLLYMGRRPMQMGDVQVMPVESFLKALAS